MATGISTGLSERELKRFGVTVAIPLAMVAAIGAWRGHTLFPTALAVLAVVLAGFALFAPGRLGSVHAVWMRGAHALGWFNTRVLLGAVYFLVITPTGIVMRLVGRDPLHRRLRDGRSYWLERKRHPDPRGSMERQF